MNIAQIDKSCHVLGPGKRYVIWVQGCIFSCEGCYNKEFQSFEAKQMLDTDEIIQDILLWKEKIEGVTFLGGEPFLQAKQLSILAEECQKNNLSVLCYTGFQYEELIERENETVNRLLKYTDVLIDGPYISSLAINRQWKGSSNQKVIYLSSRYGEKDFDIENSYEIEIARDKVMIKGFYK